MVGDMEEKEIIIRGAFVHREARGPWPCVWYLVKRDLSSVHCTLLYSSVHTSVTVRHGTRTTQPCLSSGCTRPTSKYRVTGCFKKKTERLTVMSS